MAFFTDAKFQMNSKYGFKKKKNLDVYRYSGLTLLKSLTFELHYLRVSFTKNPI